MRQKRKHIIFRSLVLSILFVAAVSCTTTNPPVDAKTGATTIVPKK